VGFLQNVAEIHDSGVLDPPRKQAADQTLTATGNSKAAGFRRPFSIWDANQAIYAAMQPPKCCYANKCVVVGIWYT